MPLTKQVAVIGGGVVGASTAWYLATHGCKVVLIDPLLQKQTNRCQPLNGTTASLGVLMGHVFRRSSGQGWRMRKRSMELWQEWIAALNTEENPLHLNKPLIQLARSEEEASFMNKLINNRKNLGLEVLPANHTNNVSRVWPQNPYGGLISHHDGYINPLELQKSLLNTLDIYNVGKICQKAIKLDRLSSKKSSQWCIHMSNNQSITKQIIIICAALGSETLLKPLGYNLPIAPVLGQVLNLVLKEDGKDWSGWPAVLSYEGINLIPYKKNRLLLGATLEPGEKANNEDLQRMKAMNGKAPNWLKYASVDSHWSGLRGRPINRTAPILKTLEPGLIIATGHYRNGVLLAPSTAEWVRNEIVKEDSENEP